MLSRGSEVEHVNGRRRWCDPIAGWWLVFVQFLFLPAAEMRDGKKLHYMWIFGAQLSHSWFLHLFSNSSKTDAFGGWLTRPTNPKCQYMTSWEWEWLKALDLETIRAHCSFPPSNLTHWTIQERKRVRIWAILIHLVLRLLLAKVRSQEMDNWCSGWIFVYK